MSHRTASSEWTDTGPLTAAIIGTSMASIWSTRRLPSQMMRSHTVALARPSARGVGASPKADERVAGPGEDHDPVVPVGRDGIEQLRELLVRGTAPHQRLA